MKLFQTVHSPELHRRPGRGRRVVAGLAASLALVGACTSNDANSDEGEQWTITIEVDPTPSYGNPDPDRIDRTPPPIKECSSKNKVKYEQSYHADLERVELLAGEGDPDMVKATWARYGSYIKAEIEKDRAAGYIALDDKLAVYASVGYYEQKSEAEARHESAAMTRMASEELGIPAAGSGEVYQAYGEVAALHVRIQRTACIVPLVLSAGRP